MWDWLRRHNDRRKDHRQRFERERDQRILSELDQRNRSITQTERRLIDELRRLEQIMQRDGQQ